MNKWSFVHIPKTGGTTIIKYIEKYIPNIIHKDRKKVKDGEKYFLIFGHFKPNLYPDRKKIIWLRHPVDRVISNYLHLKWRFENNSKKFIIIDENVKHFPKNTDIITFAKNTLHVYKFFTNYNINQFDYVGFQENMNDDLKGLCDLLNIPFDKSMIGNYRSDQKPDDYNISNKNIKKLYSLLKNDIEFYENVKREKCNE